MTRVDTPALRREITPWVVSEPSKGGEPCCAGLCDTETCLCDPDVCEGSGS